MRGTYLEAILWVLVSTGLFSVIFAAAKFADGAVGVFQLLFLRFLGGLAVILVLVTWRGVPVQQPRVQVSLHFLRAVLGCSAVAAITWATARLPVADASSMGMMYGVLTVLLGVGFLKERLIGRQGVAIAISLVGAVLVMWGQGAFVASVALMPLLVALLSAMLMAAEGLMIRILSQVQSALVMMFYMAVFGVVLMAVPAALEWRVLPVGVVLSCALLGPLSVLAQYCTIRGYRIAPLSVVGPVDYSWLLFAIVLGVVFFAEMPNGTMLLGGGCICVGGIVLSRSSR